ncbi:uncharacterized protein LOC126085969 [Elephas maximus indicus]|uniref:uncharacterized protein LOC126085969 n=1 Tax=Elephas maximus indicus TaxID=99487 RepID=UPI002116E4B1|nr:uncharacterized protein LOC126085969 [Elephas maximus indicus]
MAAPSPRAPPRRRRIRPSLRAPAGPGQPPPRAHPPSPGAQILSPTRRVLGRWDPKAGVSGAAEGVLSGKPSRESSRSLEHPPEQGSGGSQGGKPARAGREEGKTAPGAHPHCRPTPHAGPFDDCGDLVNEHWVCCPRLSSCPTVSQLGGGMDVRVSAGLEVRRSRGLEGKHVYLPAGPSVQRPLSAD